MSELPKAHMILRNAREKSGFTQQQVADYLGLKRENYCKKENNKGSKLTADQFIEALYFLITNTPQQLKTKEKLLSLLKDSTP